MNYGLLKITNKYIICRSGFKYVKFNPEIQFFQDKGIQYKGQIFQPNDGRLFFRFEDEDIIAEAMTTITVKNCLFLSETIKTVDDQYRQIVTDKNLNPYPIIERKVNPTNQHEIQAYNPNDFILFKSKIDEEIEASDPNYKYQTNILPTRFLNFLNFEVPNLDCKIINSSDANYNSLCRFSRKYKNEFLLKQNINLDSFKSMDVIDLSALDQINLSNTSLDYPILEISKTTIAYKGCGLTTKNIEKFKNDKYYYLLIYDSFQHCIRKESKENKTVLNINNTDQNPKELLFIKFNYESALKYIQEIIIDKLIS